MKMRLLLLVVLAVAALLGSGCTLFRPKPKVPVYNDATGKITMETAGKLRERSSPAPAVVRPPPEVRPVVTPSAAPAAPAMPSTTAKKPYLLKANDPLVIFLRDVPRDGDKQIEDIIDDEGMINLPFIGHMKAAGKTTAEFEREIENSYITNQIYKHITVNVVMPQQFIFVDGAVRLPNRIQLVAGLTLLQAISAAGGANDFANQEKVQLIRGEANVIYNVKELRKTPEKDPLLEAGDRIFVPESRI